MPRFGKSSTERLETCHKNIVLICNDVIPLYDFSVLCGHRNEDAQNEAYKNGRSKLKFPQSKHNSYLSLAVDVAPYPIDWKDRERFFYLAGLMKMAAANRGIKLRWGGDWDSDGDFKDQTFDDLVHFELV